jgi:molybdate transport system substrate-binding protein
MLASQIASGSPVDVFAAASTKTMAVVADAKDAVGAPVTFARNKLEIATPPGNPAKIATLADTTRSGVQLVVCAATVPCGAAAVKLYAGARLVPKPVSLEPDVKSVLTKVELKEADAGLVYRTDVKAAGAKVKGVPFAESDKAIATYPIVGVGTGKNPATGAAFISYVLSSPGTAVLKAAGFLAP